MLRSLIARTYNEFSHPVVDAVIVHGKDGDNPAVFRACRAAFRRHPCESGQRPTSQLTNSAKAIYAGRNVLDQQMIEHHDARVVRVGNDIELVRVNGDVIVSNVDIGGTGDHAPNWIGEWAAGPLNASRLTCQRVRFPGSLLNL